MQRHSALVYARKPPRAPNHLTDTDPCRPWTFWKNWRPTLRTWFSFPQTQISTTKWCPHGVHNHSRPWDQPKRAICRRLLRVIHPCRAARNRLWSENHYLYRKCRELINFRGALIHKIATHWWWWCRLPRPPWCHDRNRLQRRNRQTLAACGCVDQCHQAAPICWQHLQCARHRARQYRMPVPQI